MNPYNEPELGGSYTLELKPQDVDVKVEEHDEEIFLSTQKMKVEVQKSPLRINVYDAEGQSIVSEGKQGMAFNREGHVICYKEAFANDHYYGFGEKTGFLDKRGEKYTMWNTDVYAPHNPETDPLYESIPFL
ncbi:hypothetical protein [Piscibacillus salipiscarius]|uniref:hypothetical protein n=1 Tax=Piscibacillus salipiscarius TaxID=299480 RepID=UPI0034E19A58